MAEKKAWFSRQTPDNREVDCVFTVEELMRMKNALNYSLVGIDERGLSRVYARKAVQKTVETITRISEQLEAFDKQYKGVCQACGCKSFKRTITIPATGYNCETILECEMCGTKLS